MTAFQMNGDQRMQPRWGRYVVLAASGGALVVGGHFAGAPDFVLLAAVLAVLGFFIGLLSDRLASDLEKVDRTSSRITEIAAELSTLKRAPITEPGSTSAKVALPPHRETALPPGARVATILKRPGIIFSDGTVLVHTSSGYRQFESEADARVFLGSGPIGRLNS